jgi:hypothetical protein
MSKFRGCAYAVIAAIAFSSPLISAADANQGNELAANSYRPAVQSARPMPAPKAVTATPQTATFPEGSPDYHGSNGG